VPTNINVPGCPAVIVHDPLCCLCTDSALLASTAGTKSDTPISRFKRNSR